MILRGRSTIEQAGFRRWSMVPPTDEGRNTPVPRDSGLELSDLSSTARRPGPPCHSTAPAPAVGGREWHRAAAFFRPPPPAAPRYNSWPCQLCRCFHSDPSFLGDRLCSSSSRGRSQVSALDEGEGSSNCGVDVAELEDCLVPVTDSA
ncbi:hypothetical protein Mapa_015877 [Marchantia paleacea]|nr:hypothetical protein Mapa_015877 [Marchantia paleacea]